MEVIVLYITLGLAIVYWADYMGLLDWIVESAKDEEDQLNNF